MDPRRRLIADSALTVVGRDGIRALTHHAVDDEAGIARGSTSYYCRRRVDLLELALRRLYEFDEADLRAAAGTVASGDVDDPAQAVATLVVDWLSEHRLRSIARVELFMAASHEEELQPLLSEQLSGMRAAAAAMRRGAPGDPAAEAAFAASFMLADGLMLTVLREGRPAPSHAEVRALLRTVRPPD